MLLCLTENVFGCAAVVVVVVVVVLVLVLVVVVVVVVGLLLGVGLGVVCGDVVPALVAKVSAAAGGPALVRVEGVLVVPVFPAGAGDPDTVCSWLLTVTVVFSVPSTRENVMSVNILSPDSDEPISDMCITVSDF